MRVTDSHIYFWGSFLSNFWWTDFSLVIDNNEVTFNTSEQAFMALKALEFDDQSAFQRIINTPDGKSVKAIGRQVKNFDPQVWDKVSYNRMYIACFGKFSQDDRCREALLETKNKTLVEASPVDRIWGVGLSEDDDAILQNKNWRGENRLGKVLMAVREVI